MDIYISEANLKAFLSQHENDIFTDVIKLLRKQLNVHFNFPKEKFKEIEIFKLMAKKLTEGVGETKKTFGNNFPDGKLKTNSTNAFTSEQLSSIYWIDNEDSKKLKDVGSVILAEPGEEIESIKGLFFNQNDYIFEKKYRIGEEGFRNWLDLAILSLPLTDIIIADPYLFAQKNGDDTIQNTVECLSSFSTRSFVRVNAVVFINPAKTTYSDTEIRAGIVKGLKNSTGIKPNVSIIKTNKVHDRTILTNYKRVYSGDTFNYWNDKGIQLSRGVEIAFSSLANYENHKLFKNYLSDLQAIINFNNQNEVAYNQGDKVSNYLTF